MKKQLLSLVILSSKAFLLFSAPIGPPSAPAILDQGFAISDHSWANFRAGYVQDFLFKQNLESNRVSRPGVTSFSSVGTITWNIRERLDLQLFSGSGQLSWNYIQNNSFFSGRALSSWIWGGGAKLVLLEIQDTTVSLFGSGGYWQRMRGHYSSNEVPERRAAEIQMRYWQLGAGLSQKIGRFYPYCAAAIQRSRLLMSLQEGPIKLYEEHQLGPVLGCTLTNGILYMLNLEWRGWFEQGVTGSCEVRF